MGSLRTVGDTVELNLNPIESLSLNAIEAEIEERKEETDKDENKGEIATAVNDEENLGLGRVVEVPILAHDVTQRERSLDVQVTGKEAEMKFDDLYLKSQIELGLKSSGYIHPSPIQVQAIPLGKLGIDLIMKSKSGTGKTCAFSVIVLEQLELPISADVVGGIQAMVIAPTREIAVQNEAVLKAVGAHMPGLKVKSFIGGTSVAQSMARSERCNVVVGTPGRILHMISQGHMKVSTVRVLVLDEADRLMESAFISDVTSIFESVSSDNAVPMQVLAASATFPEALKDFLKRFMSPCHYELTVNSNPVLIGVEQYTADVCKILNKTPASLDELFDCKIKVLLDILQNLQYTQAIVFAKLAFQASKIHALLKEYSYDTVLLAGVLDQYSRLNSLHKMQNKSARILVATDLASRGIDLDGVDLVISFELPSDICTYIHRIGRAGRFGAQGVAISLSLKSDYFLISKFVSEYKCAVDILETTQQIHGLRQRTEKLKRIHAKTKEVIVDAADNENWREMLDSLMKSPVVHPCLYLDSFMGFKINLLKL